MSNIGANEMVMILVLLVIGIAGFGVWLYSLICCIKNPLLSDTNRMIGIILIAVLGLIGSLIYLFLPREPSR